MNQGKTVFSQLMSFFSDYEFNKCVEKYNGNYKTRTFSCRDHFYMMCFAQFTYRDRLRDIETCLRALSNKLYHSVIRCAISKSALAKANEQRNSSIYFDFAQTLFLEARSLYLSFEVPFSRGTYFVSLLEEDKVVVMSKLIVQRGIFFNLIMYPFRNFSFFILLFLFLAPFLSNFISTLKFC